MTVIPNILIESIELLVPKINFGMGAIPLFDFIIAIVAIIGVLFAYWYFRWRDKD